MNVSTRDFFTTIYGDNEGYVFISSKDDEGQLTHHKSFKYPEMLNPMEAYASVRDDEDLYFAPFLYSVPRRKQNMVSATPVLYADTDTFDPAKYLVEPSINVRTSEGRHHSYWLLDDVYEPEDVRRVARAIALTHSGEGVDKSGWDLAQLLRLPNSVNTKYGEPQQVEVVNNSGQVYSLEEVEAVYSAENIPAPPPLTDTDMPDEEDLPRPVDVLRRITASTKLNDLANSTPRGGQDWSDTLYRLVCEMFRAGFTAGEVLVGAWHSECNKYKRDGRPMEDLWQYDVLKAQADPKNAPMSQSERSASGVDEVPETFVGTPYKELSLLTEDERNNLTRTFVDEYCDWATSRTDAPRVYHEGGALTIMSVILSEWGYVLPEYGPTGLNLSFVIMGETTDTRKTTSRNMMKKTIRSTQNEEYTYLLTSDATSESLLDNLAERENLGSLYDRDEAQQLIEDVKGGKGYMKGFLETLNELYDGNAHGRMRKGHVTQDTRVHFVQYLMGIRSQIMENLELKDFTSGWGPRNIFIHGETEKRTRENSRLKQRVGDSSASGDSAFESLTSRLYMARTYWASKPGVTRETPFQLVFEDEAWNRITDLEWDLRAHYEDHPRNATILPSCSRLMTNTMKVAALFAMMESREIVTLADANNARYYAEGWMENVIIMIEGVNESLHKRDINKIEKYIIDHDGFVTYAKALRWATDNGYKTKDFAEYVGALEEMDTIRVIEDVKGKKSLEIKE